MFYVLILYSGKQINKYQIIKISDFVYDLN